MKIDYKVEGNIIYPNLSMLTWGPFYYHSKEKASERMGEILTDITNWVNEEDPSLNITPQIIAKGDNQITFHIMAWKDEDTIEKCNGIIEVVPITFEDEIQPEFHEMKLSDIDEYITKCECGLKEDGYVTMV